MLLERKQPLIPQPMRAVEDNEAPRFAIPAGACDSHMHVFGPLDRYPSVDDPHYTVPPGTLDHYLALMPTLGLERFVIVQPSFYGTDNRCLLDALAIVGDAARGVVMVDEGIDAETLKRFDDTGVRAVRLDLFKRANQPTAEIEAYIGRMAALVAPLGWHLQFYAPGRVVRDLVKAFAAIDVDFVIDHMGYMLEEDGLTANDFDQLLGLMRDGRCWLKLSAPYRLAKKRGYAAVQSVASAIISAAPERAIWGSDWPHIPGPGDEIGCGRDTGELLNLLMDWTGDQGLRAMILADNPARLFGFGTAGTRNILGGGTVAQ